MFHRNSITECAARISGTITRFSSIAATAALLFTSPVDRGECEARDDLSRESQLKATFFYKFSGFINWRSSDGPVLTKRLCVLGDPVISAALQRLADIDTAAGQKIECRGISESSEVQNCNLLYLSKEQSGALPRIRDELGTAGIVTVSDMPEFIEKGGTIQLLIEENHLRFIINPESVRDHGVVFDSQLLALQGRRSRK